MPRIPVSQHHSMAPGPPRATAVEIPTIFPVPIVAARVAVSEAKPLRSPSAESSRLTDNRIALPTCFCTPRKYKVK